MIMAVGFITQVQRTNTSGRHCIVSSHKCFMARIFDRCPESDTNRSVVKNLLAHVSRR